MDLRASGRLTEALARWLALAPVEREAIPCCQWKGAAALERALRRERDIVLCDGEPEARAPSLRIDARAPLDDAMRARTWAAL